MTENEEKIGYKFKNMAFFEKALTHSSYANEHNLQSNERLEFLGDSVLSIAVSDYLYRHMRKINEGDLSKLRAGVVCEQSLAAAAKRISLDKMIKLGRGEELTGGRTRPSIISDAYEAVIAAVYLDGGMDAAFKWVIDHLRGDIEKAISGRGLTDYKTELQELVQKNYLGDMRYILIGEEGRAHLKKFTVKAVLNNEDIGRGEGKNKKEAEQHAAKTALEALRKRNENL